MYTIDNQGDKKMNTKLTPEQEKAIEKSKSELIDKIIATQDVMREYPLREDGTRDFAAQLVESPVSREDIAYLVDLYYDHRIDNHMSHGDAARLTYQCCYRQSDCQFNPRARIADLKNQNKK
jgi:hypothetical protein